MTHDKGTTSTDPRLTGVRVRVDPFALAVWCALAVAASILWASPRVALAVSAAWAVAVITYLAARSG